MSNMVLMLSINQLAWLAKRSGFCAMVAVPRVSGQHLFHVGSVWAPGRVMGCGEGAETLEGLLPVGKMGRPGC